MFGVGVKLGTRLIWGRARRGAGRGHLGGGGGRRAGVGDVGWVRGSGAKGPGGQVWQGLGWCGHGAGVDGSMGPWAGAGAGGTRL